MTAAALVIILLTALFLFLKKKPDLDAREPVDSKHTQGQDEDKYDQRGEEYYDQKNYDQRGEDYYD